MLIVLTILDSSEEGRDASLSFESKITRTFHVFLFPLHLFLSSDSGKGSTLNPESLEAGWSRSSQFGGWRVTEEGMEHIRQCTGVIPGYTFGNYSCHSQGII